jgi:hypothetical protein
MVYSGESCLSSLRASRLAIVSYVSITWYTLWKCEYSFRSTVTMTDRNLLRESSSIATFISTLNNFRYANKSLFVGILTRVGSSGTCFNYYSSSISTCCANSPTPWNVSGTSTMNRIIKVMSRRAILITP